MCIGTVDQEISCDANRLVLCDFVISPFKSRILCIYAPTKVVESVVFFLQKYPFDFCLGILIVFVCPKTDRTARVIEMHV